MIEPAEHRYDVFISYSHFDREWVMDVLKPALELAGLRLCVDASDFVGGHHIRLNMTQRIRESRKTIVVLTQQWVVSGWANFESAVSNADRIVPVLLNDCDLPPELAARTAVDFRDPACLAASLGQLIIAIRAPVVQRAGPPFVLPRLPQPAFVGRDGELASLKQLLLGVAEPSESAFMAVSVTGKPGIGKSALAVQFATIHRQHFPDGIIGLRVDGKSTAALAREFAACAREPVDEDDERSPQAIMQGTFGHRRMLLIFDNADSSQLRDLLPGGRCAVILTTRHRELAASLRVRRDHQLELDTLPDRAAVALIRELVGGERVERESAATRAIISLVGHLPLALQIAGASLTSARWRTLGDYASELADERARLQRLQLPDAENDAELSVRASLQLGLRQFARDEVRFFACLRVCAKDGFSVRAAAAASGLGESRALELLWKLYRHSLLDAILDDRSRFALHSLLSTFACEIAEREPSDGGTGSLLGDARERHARAFARLVVSVEHDDQAREQLLADEFLEIISAADWLSRQSSSDYVFADVLDSFFERRGPWHAALDVTRRYLMVAEARGDRLAKIQFRLRLGKYLSLSGSQDQAHEALEPVPALLAEAGASRDSYEARWLKTVGVVLQRQGRLVEATEMLERGREIAERLQDERGLGVILNSLGAVFHRRGKSDQAIAAFERSREIAERLQDERGLSKILNSLGAVLQRRGKFDQAIEVFERGREIAERRQDERGLSMILNSLGVVFQHCGKFDQAVEALERSLQIADRVRDERGQSIVLTSLGAVLQRQSKFDQAIEVLERSREITERIRDERGLGMVLNSLGGVFQRQGKFDEAVEAFERSREIAEQMRDERALGVVLNSLGTVFQRQGKFDRAIAAFERSHEIGKALDDGQHVAMVLNSLGGVYQRRSKFAQAIAAFEQSLAIAEVLTDERHQAMVLNSLGGVYQRQDRFEEAAQAFQRSRDIAERLADERHLAIVLNSLGGVLRRQGKFAEAVVAYERSRDLQLRLGDDRGVAMVLNGLGRALQLQGRLNEAARAFERSCEIGERQQDSLHLAMALNSLGGVLHLLPSRPVDGVRSRLIDGHRATAA